MDPTANVKEQRELCKAIRGDIKLSDVERLLDLVESLDRWLVGNGHYPLQWTLSRH